MPAPNVTVNQVAMGGETIIQKVPQQMIPSPGQREHEIVNIFLGGSMQDKERAQLLLRQDPELSRRVQTLWRQQQQMKEMTNIPAEMAPHQPQVASFNSPRHSAMSMMNVRHTQPGVYSPTHPQLMRAMPAQHYSQMSGFRTQSSYHHQPVHHMVGPRGQVYTQQHSPQLSRMLTQRPPVQTYQSPHNAYTQMTPQAQPIGPPPQYPTMRVPPQPQTAGYPHMLGHHPQQMQPHNAMNQPVGPPMQASHTHQFGTAPQTVQMDHGVPGDGNFVYNSSQQQSYSLNASNNNSNNLSQAMYLTPEDRLSRLSELL